MVALAAGHRENVAASDQSGHGYAARNGATTRVAPTSARPRSNKRATTRVAPTAARPRSNKRATTKVALSSCLVEASRGAQGLAWPLVFPGCVGALPLSDNGGAGACAWGLPLGAVEDEGGFEDDAGGGAGEEGDGGAAGPGATGPASLRLTA